MAGKSEPVKATKEQIEEWENKRFSHILDCRQKLWEQQNKRTMQMRETVEKISDQKLRDRVDKTYERMVDYRLNVIAEQTDAEFKALEEQVKTAHETGIIPEQHPRVIKIADMFAGKNLDHRDGHNLYSVIRGALDFGNTVCLDFEGQDIVTPSFLHTSLRNLAKDKGRDFIKSRISIANANSTINGMVREALIRQKHEPLKATTEQINRWAIKSRLDLQEASQERRQVMEERHELERSKSPGQSIHARHAEEKLSLDQREQNDTNRFEAALKKAHETGIIPDKAYAPTHTKEEIREWVTKLREDAKDRLDKAWDDLARSHSDKLMAGERNVEIWLDFQKSRIRNSYAEENEAFEQEANRAYETGRIPGQEPEQEIDRGRER
jgi:hypothetical protein